MNYIRKKLQSMMKKIMFIGLILLLLCSGLFIPFYRVVAFEFENSGELLAFFPVENESTFEIQYIHSIHLSPVYESYYIKEKKIVQYQLTYEDYGIGMPENAEGNERFLEIDGKYVISGMNREFSQLDIRVAKVTESQQIIINGKAIAFTAFTKPGTWIRVKVRNINIWNLLQGGNIIGGREKR
jgi:hypothetical protein